jgi:hypothetical protein
MQLLIFAVHIGVISGGLRSSQNSPTRGLGRLREPRPEPAPEPESEPEPEPEPEPERKHELQPEPSSAENLGKVRVILTYTPPVGSGRYNRLKQAHREGRHSALRSAGRNLEGARDVEGLTFVYMPSSSAVDCSGAP